MIRELTDGERFAICYALKKQASKLRKMGDSILAGNGKGVTDSDDERAIHNEWLRHANNHYDAARAHENLADFILKNKTTVACTLLLPEQL